MESWKRSFRFLSVCSACGSGIAILPGVCWDLCCSFLRCKGRRLWMPIVKRVVVIPAIWMRNAAFASILWIPIPRRRRKLWWLSVVVTFSTRCAFFAPGVWEVGRISGAQWSAMTVCWSVIWRLNLTSRWKMVQWQSGHRDLRARAPERWSCD